MFGIFWSALLHRARELRLVLLKWAYGGRMLTLPDSITVINGARVEAMLKDLATVDKPIVLVCDSSGGLLMPALKLAETIETLKVPVVTIGFGPVCSAAAHIFASGHLRLLAPRAVLAMHGSRYAGKHTESISVSKMVLYAEAMGQSAFAASYRSVLVYERRVLEKYARQALPDILFGDEMVYVTRHQAMGLGLADSSFSILPLAVWAKARESRKKRTP